MRINLQNFSSVSWSKIALWIIFGLFIWMITDLKKWEKGTPIAWDVIHYYSYLPALFVHNDLKLSFIDDDAQKYQQRFWPERTPDGDRVLKVTMGMSFLYLPFFLAAHFSALLFDYIPDGFSKPYKFSIIFGSIFYCMIGLIFLRKVLSKYFSEKITATTLICLALG
ncbi:hypothetical protein JYT51_01070, partial [Candidatus Amoebophilus asiaticus]|nr:hypothetical protein [Candidatus Amoebophilus asiaticus]